MSDNTDNPQRNDYNAEQALDEKIIPLTKKLHELCHESGIPLVAAFTYSLDTEESAEGKHQKFGMGGSCYFPASASVAPGMRVAQLLLCQGVEAAAPEFLRLIAAHAAGKRFAQNEQLMLDPGPSLN